MRISGLQKMTLLDYPGKVACTVFFGGCNFRCPYCHNADLVFDSGLEPFIAEEEFFTFLSKRKGFLDGVCITGGEPMLQKDLEAFMGRIKEQGFLVKLDTNGSFPDRLEKILDAKLVDYVAMDIKNSKRKYGMTIGIPKYDTTPIEKSVKILKKSTIPYEFRTTLVREYHDLEDIIHMGTWLAGCRSYHLQTFVDSGNLIGKQELHPFGKEEMEQFANLLKTYTKAIYTRGI